MDFIRRSGKLKNKAQCINGIISLLIFSFSLIAFFVPQAEAQSHLLRVVKGKSIVLSYPEKIQTVSLANQEIADVVSVTPTDLVIIGKEVGVTSLAVWGESKQYKMYDIKVERNISGQQVVLEVQVGEVNKTALSAYGLDFLISDSDPRHNIRKGDKVIAGSYGGQVTSPDPLSQELYAQDGITGVIRWLGNKKEISTIIKALQQKGDLNLLANPQLLTLSGEKASFLVGGEIPIPIAQSVGAGGAPSVTIEWKEYGVRLNFTPTIVDTNLINLKINPEVSSLDYTNQVIFGGYVIPALRSRKADATVELNSEQSVVLGGLLSSEESETIKRVPILGHIPILSFLFSKKETSKTESELLIIVSPRIITSVKNEVIPPLPGKKEIAPSAPSEEQNEGEQKE
jgi:pilus assembly protein CpaC